VADPATGAEVGAQTKLVEAKRVSQTRWRFAATVLAASLVAAAFTGMYFRAQVTYEVAQLRKAADARATELQQERDHSAALASELATVRRDFETTAALLGKAADEGAQLRKVADANAAELQQERDQRAWLASELATVRRDFDTMAALLSKAADEVAQLRKAADAKATELQQERDHSAALASELATVRREALSSKASRKVAEAKAELKQEPDHTASSQSRAPAAGAPVAAPPARKLDPDELATLMNRAKILVAVGDISSARLLLERAAEAQEPTAALMLARTYDPDVLRTENVRNIIPDPAMARIWYQRAAQLGSADAQRRLSQWEN
jgi:TPR repeat protein